MGRGARRAARRPHRSTTPVPIVWTLTSPEVHRMLRDDCGWPPERYEQWLRDTLVDGLLPPA